jgi:hypothetical protein
LVARKTGGRFGFADVEEFVFEFVAVVPVVLEFVFCA